MKKILFAFILSALSAIAAETHNLRPNGSLNFQWDPNSEPDLSYYRFYTQEVVTNPDGSIAVTQIGNDKIIAPTAQFKKTGLLPNKTYRFYVTAVNNDSLQSDPSNILEINTTVPEATAPDGLVVTVAGEVATVKWTANPPEQAIVKYDVDLTSIPDGLKTSVSTAGTEVSVPIVAGAYYTVSVTAVGPLTKATATTLILGKLNAPKRLIFEGKVTWEFE